MGAVAAASCGGARAGRSLIIMTSMAKVDKTDGRDASSFAPTVWIDPSRWDSARIKMGRSAM